MRGMRRVVPLVLAAAVLAVTWAPPVEAVQVDTSQVLRFHVVASSDTPGDQERKYRVRDAVLDLLREQLREASNIAEARDVLLNHMDEIEHTAREVGEVTEVTVRLARSSFPAVDYTTAALPAGEYWALQVMLGSGQGENWWCVLFPSLCLGPATPSPEDGVEGVTSPRFRLILGKVLHRMLTGGLGEQSEGRLYDNSRGSDLQ